MGNLFGCCFRKQSKDDEEQTKSGPSADAERPITINEAGAGEENLEEIFSNVEKKNKVEKCNPCKDSEMV